MVTKAEIDGFIMFHQEIYGWNTENNAKTSKFRW